LLLVLWHLLLFQWVKKIVYNIVVLGWLLLQIH
jgi:hypothetical protein